MFLSPDEVLEIARAGAALGCKEALFTLGDRPEDRWPAAREWLDAHGYDDTLSYVRAMAVRVLEETGLLPHLNPGVMSWEELARLKPVAPSMGMMLETSSRRLFETPGEPHFGSPDKDPEVRLRVLADAGRQAVPFTTGILVGIGESPRERVESVLDIRRVAREHGHVQEVIVQNFRAKPDTAMRDDDDLPLEDYLATIAVTRLLLGPRMRVQAPPNLTDLAEVVLLLRAGVDDWGGVSPLTPDHVNPERPWPHLDDLARLTARGRVRAARAAHRAPGVRAAGRPVDRPAGPGPRHRAGRSGRSRCRGPVPGRPAVAAARRVRRRLRRVRGRQRGRSHRPARDRRHHRAHRRTGAATSTRSTATGRRSVSTRPTSRPVLPPAARRTSGSTATSAPPSRSLRRTRRRSRTPTTPGWPWR